VRGGVDLAVRQLARLVIVGCVMAVVGV